MMIINVIVVSCTYCENAETCKPNHNQLTALINCAYL